MDELKPGLRADFDLTVTGADTAAQWGSGLVPVYSTPALVGAMEKTAVLALEGQISFGQTTVGGRIEVRHLAPTPVGMAVHVTAELVEVEKIGEASHDRFVIDQSKFMQKVRSKGG